jgi:hypothetical protein
MLLVMNGVLIAATLIAVWWMPSLFFVFVALWFCFGFVKQRLTPLQIRAVRDEYFWIAGCGSEFLDECAAEFGRRRDVNLASPSIGHQSPENFEP